MDTLAYHGTTAELGKQIEAEGLLRPRGDDPGNWSGGLEGGNPSNPDWVYVCLDKDTALGYMKEIARRNRAQSGAVVIVQPDFSAAHPDEDLIFERMFNEPPSPMNDKLWEILGSAMAVDWQELRDYATSGEAEIPDSELSSNMILVAERVKDVLSSEEMHALFRNAATLAFDRPLPVVSVEYFNV